MDSINPATKEWSRIWHHPELKLNLFQAFHATHSYPRHSHDYYVIALVEHGSQSFVLGNKKHITHVGGLILLNPGDVHTGEVIDNKGYGFRAFYPTEGHLQTAIFEMTGQCTPAPKFSEPRIDTPQLARLVGSFHQAVTDDVSALEHESRFIWTLVQLIKQLSANSYPEKKTRKEHSAVKKARSYIQENYAEKISLSKLANYVNLSRYYLLRVFRNEIGMPPHTYLETLRIQKAQQFIAEGRPLAQVAHDIGFSSQSHFTQRFKHILGVTPGQYAQRL